MRLKIIAIIYTILMVSILFITISIFDKQSYKQVDMLEINDRIQAVEEGIENGNADEICRINKCQVVYLTDEFYASIINNAIKDSSVIIDKVEDGEIVGKYIFSKQKETYNSSKENAEKIIIGVVCCCGIAGDIVLLFVYLRYIKPFKRLEKFAANVSKGDLDFPLLIKKTDYFGAFSEAFDGMREALKNAKEGEYQANKSKKELIASLSHDIKTPVATIKAICELLNVKVQDEFILNKIGIIDSKAKVIDSLMNNMFNAALEELEVLKINPTEEPTMIIKDMFKDINYFDKIKFQNDIPEFLVYMDKLRLIQVIDNIINNSYKYANTDIHVSFFNVPGGLKIVVRDFGNSFYEEDLALVSEKFYRGKNAVHESGSGLGLYLAKVFLQGMKGDLTIESDNGFIVTMFLKKI